MSTTIFLRFPSRDAAREAFGLYGSGTVTGPDGEPYWPSCGTFGGHRYDLAILYGDGLILRPTGETVETDEGATPVLAPIEGYHVNVLWHGPVEMIPDFGPARIYPVTPECVFAA